MVKIVTMNNEFEKLQLLHETISNMESLELPITNEVLQKRTMIEDEVIKSELLPLISDQIEPIIGWLTKKFVIVVDYDPEVGLDVKMSQKKAIIDAIRSSSPTTTTTTKEGRSYSRKKQFSSNTSKSPSPDPYYYASKIPELKWLTANRPFLTWQAICDSLQIDVSGDSARRKLKRWVEENKPFWPEVPELNEV